MEIYVDKSHPNSRYIDFLLVLLKIFNKIKNMFLTMNRLSKPINQ